MIPEYGTGTAWALLKSAHGESERRTIRLLEIAGAKRTLLFIAPGGVSMKRATVVAAAAMLVTAQPCAAQDYTNAANAAYCMGVINQTLAGYKEGAAPPTLTATRDRYWAFVFGYLGIVGAFGTSLDFGGSAVGISLLAMEKSGEEAIASCRGAAVGCLKGTTLGSARFEECLKQLPQCARVVPCF